jgi:uridine kinase
MDAEKTKAEHSIPASAVLRTVNKNRKQWSAQVSAKRSLVDFGFTMLRRIHPKISASLLPEGKQAVVKSRQEFSETVMALMESIVTKSPDSENKTFTELVNKRPMIILLGARRGTGKTTVTKSLVDPLKAVGISTVVLHTDYYAQRPEVHSYHGYKDNPRNSDISALLKDIRGFKAGKSVAIRTSRYGESHETVSALKTPVMIVEGIYALSILRVIKEADIVCALLIDPAARVMRAMKRDSLKSKDIDDLKEYAEIDEKATFWWSWTGLLRMIDAHVVYKIAFDEEDLRDFGKLSGWDAEKLEVMLRNFNETKAS